MNKKFKIIMALKIVLGITAFVILFGFGTMYLWNWLVPSLFHGPIITFGQAIGLLILCKVLFGGRGFGKGSWGGHGSCGSHGGWGRHHWKHRMHERMQNMSPEEKEQFKQRIKDRCKSWYWNEEQVNEQNTDNKNI